MNSIHSEPNTPVYEIEEGFEVRDCENDPVGTVKHVRFSDDNPRTPYPESLSQAMGSDQQANLVTSVADTMFENDNLPEELRMHINRKGFVRIGRGIFQPDVVATMDQVSHVANNQVFLNVTKEELIAV